MTRPTDAGGSHDGFMDALDRGRARQTTPTKAALRTLDVMLLIALGATLLHEAPTLPDWLRTCDVTVGALQIAGLLAGALRGRALTS